jgi:uncharacterized protein (DUF2267 family)
MKDINDDRKAELDNVISKISSDAHNRCVSDCHDLVLALFDNCTDEDIKDIYSMLESKIVEMYKK